MGTLWVSSTTYSKRYLAVAWERRHELADYERRGFGLFVYMTLSAHLESVIAAVLQNRYWTILTALQWKELPPFTLNTEGGKSLCDVGPLSDSVQRIVRGLNRSSHTAALAKLVERYNETFETPLRDVIGSDLSADLKALGELRNLIAHGREISFDLDHTREHAISLDGHPLQPAFARLRARGILKSLDINGRNHNEFTQALFGDEALLHFYQAVVDIEAKTLNAIAFLPEKIFLKAPPKLPLLTA